MTTMHKTDPQITIVSTQKIPLNIITEYKIIEAYSATNLLKCQIFIIDRFVSRHQDLEGGTYTNFWQ